MSKRRTLKETKIDIEKMENEHPLGLRLGLFRALDVYFMITDMTPQACEHLFYILEEMEENI